MQERESKQSVKQERGSESEQTRRGTPRALSLSILSRTKRTHRFVDVNIQLEGLLLQRFQGEDHLCRMFLFVKRTRATLALLVRRMRSDWLERARRESQMFTAGLRESLSPKRLGEKETRGGSLDLFFCCCLFSCFNCEADVFETLERSLVGLLLFLFG